MSERDNIELSVSFNLNDAMAQLNTMTQKFEALRQTFDDAPDMTRGLNVGIERAIDQIDLLKRKVEQASNASDSRTLDTLKSDILSGQKDLSVMYDLFSGTTDFSTTFAHNMFSGLPQAVRSELNSMSGELKTIIRSTLKSGKFGSLQDAVQQVMRDSGAAELYMSKRNNTTEKDFQNLVTALIPQLIPTYQMPEFQRRRYGSVSQANIHTRPFDFLPKSLQNAYKAGKYIRPTLSTAESAQIMGDNEYEDFFRLVSRNDAAFRAASKAGLISHSNGKAALTPQVSRAAYEQFREHMYADFVNRASGKASNRIDFYMPTDDFDIDYAKERLLATRMTSSSAGRALGAFRELEDWILPGSWKTSRGNSSGQGRIISSAPRSLEQYEIKKFDLADLISNPNADKPESVKLIASWLL